MDIGFIGAGNTDTGTGKRLSAKGHSVMVSFARSQDSCDVAARAVGGGAWSDSPDKGARLGQVVIVPTPRAVTLDVRGNAASLARKVVWDATNPLKPDMSGSSTGTSTSASEGIAAAAPDARMVRAVPPFAEVLHSQSKLLGGTRLSGFVCSDDAAARSLVLGSVDNIKAAEIDAGPVRSARYTEPLGTPLVRMGYVQGMGTRIGAALLRAPTAAPAIGAGA